MMKSRSLRRDCCSQEWRRHRGRTRSLEGLPLSWRGAALGSPASPRSRWGRGTLGVMGGGQGCPSASRLHGAGGRTKPPGPGRVAAPPGPMSVLVRPMALGGAADLPPAMSLSQQARDLPDSALPFEALPHPNPPFFLSGPDENRRGLLTAQH